MSSPARPGGSDKRPRRRAGAHTRREQGAQRERRPMMTMVVTRHDPADAAFQAYGYYAWNADEIGKREKLAAFAIEEAWLAVWNRGKKPPQAMTEGSW